MQGIYGVTLKNVSLQSPALLDNQQLYGKLCHMCTIKCCISMRLAVMTEICNFLVKLRNRLWVQWKECELPSNFGDLYCNLVHTGTRVLEVVSHLTSLFPPFQRYLSKEKAFPHFALSLFTRALLFGGIKLEMMYSAGSPTLEIAAGYSGAASCRRPVNH